MAENNTHKYIIYTGEILSHCDFYTRMNYVTSSEEGIYSRIQESETTLQSPSNSLILPDTSSCIYVHCVPKSSTRNSWR